MIPFQLTTHPENVFCNVCKEPLYLGEVIYESLSSRVLVHEGRCQEQWLAWRKRIFLEEDAMDEKTSEEQVVTFTACEFLDFSDNYVAEKNLIQQGAGVKVCWDREVPMDRPQLVQFCQKRGRLNFAEACLDEGKKQCHLYREFTHSVPLDTINTE